MSDNNTNSSTAPLSGGAPADSTKLAQNGAGYQRNANIGAGREGRLINVEPPRREDLQPSYAQNLVGESEQGTHGWYGSMSTYPGPLSYDIERDGAEVVEER